MTTAQPKYTNPSNKPINLNWAVGGCGRWLQEQIAYLQEKPRTELLGTSQWPGEIWESSTASSCNVSPYCKVWSSGCSRGLLSLFQDLSILLHLCKRGGDLGFASLSEPNTSWSWGPLLSAISWVLGAIQENTWTCRTFWKGCPWGTPALFWAFI